MTKNPPQPDITRTITETVETLVHTYLAKIDKPRNNTELEAYNKKVDKLTEVAVHKLTYPHILPLAT